jgi:hypothetical protein
LAKSPRTEVWRRFGTRDDFIFIAFLLKSTSTTPSSIDRLVFSLASFFGRVKTFFDEQRKARFFWRRAALAEAPFGGLFLDGDGGSEDFAPKRNALGDRLLEGRSPSFFGLPKRRPFPSIVRPPAPPPSK